MPHDTREPEREPARCTVIARVLGVNGHGHAFRVGVFCNRHRPILARLQRNVNPAVSRYGARVLKSKVDRWREVIAELAALDDVVGQVGWFDEDSARIAFINDRGGNRGDNPPPRPVLGPGFDAAREDVSKLFARAVNQVMRGKSGRQAGESAADAAGAVVEQAVRDAIESIAPPNAPSTIAGKHGYSAPLRGFSPDRIWNRLEHRVVRGAEAGDDEVEDDAPAS